MEIKDAHIADTTQPRNEIVVYQPDETIRLDVRLKNDTVWLTQLKIAELFGVQKAAISKHLKNIFSTGELREELVVSKMETTTAHGAIDGKTQTHWVSCYNLDAIIAVGYRVNSIRATQFRIWATKVLREYLLRGYAFNQRLNLLEDRVDRRIAGHNERITLLEKKVDFFVQTSMPPVQGVFYDGQVFDANVFASKHILSARKSIFLIDNWIDVVTLELLAKKAAGVVVEIVTSHWGNKLTQNDIATFNSQYGGLSVRESKNFHDRFLIIDDKELYLVGASLKDLGRKCFAFAKMDPGEIAGLKARV